MKRIDTSARVTRSYREDIEGKVEEDQTSERLTLPDVHKLDETHMTIGLSVEASRSENYGKKKIAVRAFVSLPCNVDPAEIQEAFNAAYEIASAEAADKGNQAWEYFFGGRG